MADEKQETAAVVEKVTIQIEKLTAQIPPNLRADFELLKQAITKLREHYEHPDHGLPSGGYPSQGLPSGGRPDQGLPSQPGRPDQDLPPGASPKK